MGFFRSTKGIAKYITEQTGVKVTARKTQANIYITYPKDGSIKEFKSPSYYLDHLTIAAIQPVIDDILTKIEPEVEEIKPFNITYRWSNITLNSQVDNFRNKFNDLVIEYGLPRYYEINETPYKDE